MFIAKKRDVGLMRLALANKEAEIRHLEEEMDRAEKRLRQQQEQLASTEEKFNNFLKHSNLEQDAAVRRAEVESKAKLERLIDIKKLSAQISHMEQDMRKTDVQLELCKEYKHFMDSLTESQWFYDVLCGLRVKDISEVILRETEEAYTRRAEELTKAAEKAAARRESRQRSIATTLEREAAFLERLGFSEKDDGSLDEGEEEEEVSLEVQLGKLHQDLEAEAQRRQEEATASIKREVGALSVDEARAILDKEYPQERIPMYFSEPDQILDIFINVEEGNLFLIQNSQELEEELERVAMEYFREQEEMSTMVRQRHAQMESLATRIKGAQQRLRQLEERLVDLDSIESGADTAGDATRNKNCVGGLRRDKAGTVMRQEVLKKLIERVVADIFLCISQQQSTAARRPEDGEGGEDTMQGAGKAKPIPAQKRASHYVAKPKAKGRKKDRGVSGAAAGGGVDGHNDTDAGANMWPVEMLTIIENKIDEYIRYINDPENGVDQSLIMSVIKMRDKERRHQARVVQLERQSAEREERNRRALERSKAPVVKRCGKPIMWRSRPPVETMQGTEVKQGPVATKEADQDDEFFR
ncbi:hypothetical protein TRSC58_03377 [Trypanosoma rangeli SC58]|uniref:DUF4200 domain-containing protein n=1 Tax=Trypanosoma rangeli SC58 TaxID=429131 RepID=A0A061J6I1_TRYRA|nr:hypothetical protein TRSC58_03377 [Trypanosoma rangeli SC58]